ncbi:MAG: UpxY family transcription antiterminator [Candidatus Phocaeicola faecipullorum]|nr:UpxY family transcription antiterminator [Candidatus Phocaeicola faecipullorum]
MENEHWYAMYVKMHHEKKTAEKLDNMGVRNYLPLQETVKQWSDRKKKVKEVVIPMIIFIRTDEKTRIEVLKSVSSINGTMIDKATHKPAIIRDEEMKRFMFMLDYSEETVRFISEPLKPGEKVEVVKGPLAGLKGELIDTDGKCQMSVRLNMLGCAMVDIPAGYLKKIENE